MCPPDTPISRAAAPCSTTGSPTPEGTDDPAARRARRGGRGHCPGRPCPALVARSRLTCRRKTIPAARDRLRRAHHRRPAARRAGAASDARVPRPSPERIAAARAHAAGFARRTQAGTRSAPPGCSRASARRGRRRRATDGWLWPVRRSGSHGFARGSPSSRGSPSRAESSSRTAPFVRRAESSMARQRASDADAQSSRRAARDNDTLGRLRSRRCCSSRLARASGRRAVERRARPCSDPRRSSQTPRRRSTTAGPTTRPTGRRRPAALRTVYLGGAGVVDALHRLAQRGLVELQTRLRPVPRRSLEAARLPRRRSRAQPLDGRDRHPARAAAARAVGGEPRPARGADRRERARRALELMWGSPGTILAGRELGLDVSDEHRMAARRSAMRTACGRRISTGTRSALPRAGARLRRLRARAGRRATASRRRSGRFAVDEDGLVNWPPVAGSRCGRPHGTDPHAVVPRRARDRRDRSAAGSTRISRSAAAS